MSNSSFRDAMKQINAGKKPVAVIVFGPDGLFKDAVRDFVVINLVDYLPVYAPGLTAALAETRKVFSEHKNTVLQMGGSKSIDQGERMGTVSSLKQNGATRVVGIYARRTSALLPDEYAGIAEQKKWFEENPPSLDDGFDTLFVVDDE